MSQRSTFNGPLTWSLLFIGGAIVLVLTTMPSLLSAALAPTASNVDVKQALTSLLEEHEESLGNYEDRFVGRSVFFKPKQPRKDVVRRSPPPPPPPPGRTRTEPVEPPPPAKPATYRGPGIQVFLGNEVWFENGLRLRVGEDAVDGVQVMKVDAPWIATIAYNGWEYEVPLFLRFSPADPPPPSADDPDFFEKPGDEDSASRRRAARAGGKTETPPQASLGKPEKTKIPAE